MPELFIGVLALILVLWLVRFLVRTDPQDLIKLGRTAGGIVALAGAAFLGWRGLIFAAVPLGVTGLSLLGWLPGGMRAYWLPAGMRGYWSLGQKSSGQVSRVRSNFVEMSLDHDTGAMTGVIVAGRLKGTSLDAVELSVLVSLLAEFDEESRNLLAAYLDRRHPRWREDVDDGAASGRRGPKMSEEEAYQILGLQPGASADEIGRAHRGLMKKVHPDQGGSTYLAARVNEAKDVLLRHHE